MSVNKVILIGNVGSKKVSNNGTKVVRLSLATTKKGYKTSDGKEIADRTEWHNIVAWRNLANLCEEFVEVGSQIYVEGELASREYDKDGVFVKVWEIVANSIQFVGGKKVSGSDGAVQEQKDDLPW